MVMLSGLFNIISIFVFKLMIYGDVTLVYRGSFHLKKNVFYIISFKELERFLYEICVRS